MCAARSRPCCVPKLRNSHGERTMTPRHASPGKAANTVKLRLKIADRTLTATLIDGETTDDFVSLLPLTLTMNDLFRREKFGHLPRAIAQRGDRMHLVCRLLLEKKK